MNIVIRKATENDLNSILNLYAQPEMDNGKVLSIIEAKKLYVRMKSYPDYDLYIAVDENNIVVGTYALLIMDNLGHVGSPSGIVEDVVVDPAYQGKGIGKIMMQHAMELCKQKKCYKLVLSSNSKRKNAHQFYESLGFKQHGISFVINI